jgi:hypothetical protein
MSVFGSVGSLDLNTGAGKNYFAKFDEKLSEVKEKGAGIREKASTLAEPDVDEMFDSHYSAYQTMAQDLRDSLPSALSSDADIAKWETKLKQANEFAEKSKGYFTSEYAQFQKNSEIAAGSNPQEYESRGVKDGKTVDDYQYEFARMNGRDLFQVSTDENGMYVIDGGDAFKVFDEHNFMPDLQNTDVRNPDSWWAGHSVAGMDNKEQAADNIEGRIIKDPTEAANAHRWWIESQGLETTVDQMDEEERRIAVRKYAEEASNKWTPNQNEETADSQEEDSFDFNPSDVVEVSGGPNGGRSYNLPPNLTLDFGNGSFNGVQFVWFEGLDPMIYSSDGTVFNIRPQDLEALEQQMDDQLGDGAFDNIYDALAPPLPGQ